MQIYQIRDAAVRWDEARGTAALADVVLRWEGIGRLGEIIFTIKSRSVVVVRKKNQG
jgi:hypothetical protein